MGYHNERFPTDDSWGTSTGYGYRTVITSNESGVEDRVSRWENARLYANITYSTKDYAALARLSAFFLAREGAANSFPYRNPFDFHSNPDDPSFIGTPGIRDQLIGTGDGVALVSFQLIKTYVSGLVEKVHVIRKPVLGTVRIWVDGTEVFSGFSVNYDTGVVSFMTPPLGDIEASFEYDVPMRFAEDTDAGLFLRADTYGDGSVQTLTLIEDRNAEAGYVDRYFTGGSLDVSISSPLTISTSLARVYHLQASVGSLSVILPSPASIPPGWPIFLIVNTGANSFAVKDHTNTTLVTLATNQGCYVALTEQASSSKVWITL